ncbi:hypothetical protein COOONC_15783 [Cooperia oncophora]
MELVDILNAEDDSSSVELLQEDSDSTISVDTENHYKDPFFMDVQGSNRTPTSAASSHKLSAATQSSSTSSAADVWRESYRSPRSTCSADSEYSSQLPFFMGAYSSRSVASSFLRDVDRMRIAEESSSRAKTPQPISLDEVSSSSDLIGKQVSGVEDELAMAARWAEDHDLRIYDGDEFLECSAQPESSEKRRSEDTAKRKRESRPNIASRTQTGINSVGPETSDRDKVGSTSKHKVDSTRTSIENARKRNSSPIQRNRSLSRSRGQERKRFASDRSSEKRREGRQSRCRESSPRSSHTRTSTTSSRLSASSAEKAHNLPRYLPVERRYDFTRWLDSDGELVLHKVKDVATGLVSAPLGCTYDSALDTFVFTRHDSILFSTSDGRLLDNLTLKGFDQPCAICVLRPGDYWKLCFSHVRRHAPTRTLSHELLRIVLEVRFSSRIFGLIPSRAWKWLEIGLKKYTVGVCNSYLHIVEKKL